ncbi:UNVERIFIED_ORG: NADPH-dependent 2,4-dienoyl-CoA reductase/sulfur reductase-like enzyme [Burkholderia sp. CF145]|uniref:FAD/NAD(P)-dependent oxidoreductase n=1 Tax=Paraburkholderia hospita TaxID=169430 RepID=UPI000271617D|nr:NAD(P)/FAD-dependent oxidoreductase [Paraburkholderia hospita]EUC19495.1 Pyridine nucleotide-disulfide oxidoreductase, FAD/NAD(P)-binding domain containing protein [Burkholderia sp. BT03]SKD04379.1 NADPH-dependent 2,4-dienoyl-CoA reductase, sulfur reductase [Paraburkholderia hospita]
MAAHRDVKQPKVIVIGAGPAGVRAAQALVEAGLRPLVIDEGRRDGGQIYRRQPEGFSRSYDMLYGTEAARAASLHRDFDALRAQIDYLPDTLVWNIGAKAVHVVSGTRHDELAFDSLIICSGATDRLMPVPGWHHAGTFSLGGAQVALKSQGCAVGARTVVMGTGPLLYLVAAQYVKAGATVSAVLDTSTLAQRVRALPQLLAIPTTLRKGIALMSVLRRARVPVHRGVTPVAIDGSPEHGVTGVRVKLANGATLDVQCDAVALGYHLRAETQLADLAGCEFRFDHATQTWLPHIDADGRSSVAGVYLAGDGARVRGADAAERAGRLAALAALRDAGIEREGTEGLRAELARYTRFAAGLRAAFPWPARFAAVLPDETIVCRCEAITAGELRRVVREMGAKEANRAKAFSRVGMGRCQGRFCAHAGAEVIAAEARVPLEAVGRLRGQAPVKPLSMALVSTCAVSRDAEEADTCAQEFNE